MIIFTDFVRPIDGFGRIVIPKEVRALCGIDEKDALNILVDQDTNRIILEKFTSRCAKCHSTEELRAIKPDLYLCAHCIEQLK